MSESKFPTKTAFGVAALLWLASRGKGWGIKLGNGTGAATIPPELLKMMSVRDNQLTGEVDVITIQKGSKFNNSLAPSEILLAKYPAVAGSPQSAVSSVLDRAEWFKSGKVKLIVRVRNDTLRGNEMLLRKALFDSGIPVVFLSNVDGKWTDEPTKVPTYTAKELRSIGFKIPANIGDEVKMRAPQVMPS